MSMRFISTLLPTLEAKSMPKGSKSSKFVKIDELTALFEAKKDVK